MAESVSPESPAGLRLPGLILVSILFYVLFAVAYAPATAIGWTLDVEVRGAIAVLLQLLVVWPLIIWLALRWSGFRFLDIAPRESVKVVTFVGVAVAAIGGAIPFLAVAGSIPMPSSMQERLTSLAENPTALVVAALLVAPIAEELFFRGIVLQSLLLRYSPRRAIWISAIAFSVFHLNPWQAVIALPAGLFFGWVTLRTGSILPAILGHLSVNATPNLLMRPILHLFGYGSQLETLERLPWSVILSGAALCVIGLRLVLMHGRRRIVTNAMTRAAPEADASASHSIT